jgi:hypothetical protein
VQVGEEGRRVEQRRQEDEQDDLRVELDLGHARYEADRKPPDHEQDRVGHPHDPRHHCEGGYRDEEPEDQ